MKNEIIERGTTGALIARVKDNGQVYEYVSAWGYNDNGTWSQGHYFTPYPNTEETRADALKKATEHFNKNYR